MPASLVIGLDLGTTTAKALAIDADSRVAGSASRSVELNAPQPGWATQSPEDYVDAVREALKGLASQVNRQQLAGLAISGAMHSIIPLDGANQPLTEGLTWADRRGRSHIQSLRRQIDAAALHRRTGCPLRALYHPARLRGLQDQAYADSIARFVSMKEWIILALTGELACDRGFASTTGLYNLRQRSWDDQALQLAGISAAQLSPLVDSHAQVGRLEKAIAKQLNLPAGLPVIAGSTDGALANLGAAGGRPGPIVVTVGTSGAVRRTVAEPAVDDHEQTWCYLIADELYIRGGAVNNGGLVAEWIIDQCYRDLPESKRFSTMFAEAAQVEAGADGLVLLPYLAGERTPLWDSDASASVHGLKRYHTRGHLARAALEAVAFCLRDVFDAIDPVEKLSRGKARLYLTGGITHSPVWCQIVADVLNCPIDPCKEADGSAIGAARLGQWALGHVEKLGDFSPLPTHDSIRPDPRRAQTYAGVYQRFQQLKAAMRSD